MFKKIYTQKNIQIAIFVVSLIASVGSLYYSTHGDPFENMRDGNFFAGNGFPPCDLCWYARILMYPIVLITGIGILKKDNRFTDYVLPMSVIGFLMGIYQYALQKLPIENVVPCSVANPCSAIQIEYFGFITIPFMSLAAFGIITILSWMNMRMNKKS